MGVQWQSLGLESDIGRVTPGSTTPTRLRFKKKKKREMPSVVAPAAVALGSRKAAIEAVNVIRALSVPSRFAVVGVVAVAAAVVVIADAFNVVVLAVVVVVAGAGVAVVLKALRCSDGAASWSSSAEAAEQSRGLLCWAGLGVVGLCVFVFVMFILCVYPRGPCLFCATTTTALFSFPLLLLLGERFTSGRPTDQSDERNNQSLTMGHRPRSRISTSESGSEYGEPVHSRSPLPGNLVLEPCHFFLVVGSPNLQEVGVAPVGVEAPSTMEVRMNHFSHSLNTS